MAEIKYFRYLVTPKNGYWLDEEHIRVVESRYSASYVGYWTIRNKKGEWTEEPVDCFYCANPDISKGHSNYFGMFTMGGETFIVNAESAFDSPIYGIQLKSGECLVSRYRHDYVEKGGCFIDGGRDYCRVGGTEKLVKIWCRNGRFDIEEDVESVI